MPSTQLRCRAKVAQRCNVIRSLCGTVVGIFMAVMLVLVGGRFLALLAAANRNSQLVKGLFRHSDFWVKPFYGMFGLSNEAVQGGGVFEPASLMALTVYILAGMLVLGVLSGAVVERLDRFDRFGHAHNM